MVLACVLRTRLALNTVTRESQGMYLELVGPKVWIGVASGILVDLKAIRLHIAMEEWSVEVCVGIA